MYTLEPYTVKVTTSEGRAGWPTNFAGTGYAVKDPAGKVVKRFAFRVEALQYAERRNH
jgi:hypothetical protein